MAVCVLLLFAATASGASAASGDGDVALRFHWQDTFTASEQKMLSGWIDETQAALVGLVGPLPMPVHVYFHRSDGASEPVPWANTERGRQQGVHLHVDPSYPLRKFRADWTAAHELSHLVIPYLGSRNAWFAEGFASYMQYQVMLRTGVLDAGVAARNYHSRLNRAQRRYNAISDRRFHKRSFVWAAPRLRERGMYPTMYWGGAAYFLRVDYELRKQPDAAIAGGLAEVLQRYLACCRTNTARVAALIQTLDEVSGTAVFGNNMRRFMHEPGFPEFGPLVDTSGNVSN